jgi:hypothetical protein
VQTAWFFSGQNGVTVTKVHKKKRKRSFRIHGNCFQLKVTMPSHRETPAITISSNSNFMKFPYSFPYRGTLSGIWIRFWHVCWCLRHSANWQDCMRVYWMLGCLKWTGCWDAWNERVIGFDLFQDTFFLCVLGLRKNHRNSLSGQSISVPAYHSHCSSPSNPGWQTLKVTTNLINTFPTNRHFASTFPSHEPLLSDNNWSCLLLLWAERYSQRLKADQLAQNDSIPLSEFSSTY